jgi:hypothetical protein
VVAENHNRFYFQPALAGLLRAAGKPAKAGWKEKFIMARYHQLKLVAKDFNSSLVSV